MEDPQEATPTSSSSMTSSEEDAEEDGEDSEDEYRENEDDEENEENGNNGKPKKTEKRRHRCPKCDKLFTFPNKLREHMRIHEEKRYPCLECPTSSSSSTVSFDTFNQLRAHHKTCHSISHKCELCSYTNSRPAFVRKHFKLNHIHGVPCTISGCSMKVAKNRLKAHIKEVHSSESAFPEKPIRAKLSFSKCPHCDFRPNASSENFDEQQRELMSHIWTVHDQNGKIMCEQGCGSKILISEIGKHLETCSSLNSRDTPTTSSEPPGSPEFADTNTQSFVSSSTDYQDLEDDVDSEDEAPPPKKLKKNSGDVNREKKIIRLKKFVCDRKVKDGENEICGKSFRTEQALSDHFNIHDDLKPYGCLTCNQRFHGRDRFAVHLSKYHMTSIKDITARDQLK